MLGWGAWGGGTNQGWFYVSNLSSSAVLLTGKGRLGTKRVWVWRRWVKSWMSWMCGVHGTFTCGPAGSWIFKVEAGMGGEVGIRIKECFFKSIRWVRLEYFYRLEGTYQWGGKVFRGWAQRDCYPWAGKGGGMTGKNRCLRRCVGWSLRTFSLLASNFVEKEARPMKA